jgi:hypothetical protein
VVVTVDEPGYRHPTVQVDDLRLSGELALSGGNAVADVGHETAADREHAGNGAAPVHGVNAAVAQDQVLGRRGSVAGRVRGSLGRARQRHAPGRRDARGRAGDRAGLEHRSP